MGDNMDDIMSLIDPKLTNPQNTRKLLSKLCLPGLLMVLLLQLPILPLLTKCRLDKVKEVSSQSAKGSMIANVAT